jgi:hypothetical protein
MLRWWRKGQRDRSWSQFELRGPSSVPEKDPRRPLQTQDRPTPNRNIPRLNGMDRRDSSVSASFSCSRGMISRVRALSGEWQPPPDDVPSPSGPPEFPPPEPQEPTRAPNEVPPEPDEVPQPSPSEEPQRRAGASVRVEGFACRSSALAAPRPSLLSTRAQERFTHQAGTTDRSGIIDLAYGSNRVHA